MEPTKKKRGSLYKEASPSWRLIRGKRRRYERNFVKAKPRVTRAKAEEKRDTGREEDVLNTRVGRKRKKTVA